MTMTVHMEEALNRRLKIKDELRGMQGINRKQFYSAAAGILEAVVDEMYEDRNSPARDRWIEFRDDLKDIQNAAERMARNDWDWDEKKKEAAG